MSSFEASQLHVIAVISNPVRFESRYRLYREFADRMAAAGVTLWTIEAAFGARDHAVTTLSDMHHYQLRVHDEFWHKESLINYALTRLPASAQYIAWIDADVEFVRKDWATETIHALQHYDVMQPWSDAIDLGPNLERVETHTSFCACHVRGKTHGDKYGPFFHPGFAWAARRSALQAMGGLMDFPILGAADHHMACAFVGRVRHSAPGGLHPNYYAGLDVWQERAEAHIRRNIGYIPGTILHHWHGKKKQRRYQERWAILQKNQFDPATDIKRDLQGIYQLANKKPELRDDLRAYFRQRNEDSIDTE